MNKKNKYLALLSLALSGGAIYTLPYLKYVFYDQMISVMNITNAQLGTLMTMYAIGGIILYIPGGVFADKISAKKSIIISLILTSVLGIVYTTTFSLTIANICWLLMSATTAFVFWCSLMKAIALVGGDEESGKMYGLYYAGAGLIRGACNAIALYVLTKFVDPEQGLKMAIYTLAALNILAALMVFKFYDDVEIIEETSSDKFNIKEAKRIIKNPIVWLVSISILCVYSLYAIVSYFTPYLSDVIGISPNLSSTLSIIRTNLLLVICAPLGGYIVDKMKSTTKWFMIASTVAAILFGVLIVLPKTINASIFIILTLIISSISFMIFGVGFSIVSECKFPTSVTATVIGIASIIGFLPDFYMHSLSGVLIDSFGDLGYRYIFAILLTTCLVCIVSCYLIRKKLKKEVYNELE